MNLLDIPEKTGGALADLMNLLSGRKDPKSSPVAAVPTESSVTATGVQDNGLDFYTGGYKRNHELLREEANIRENKAMEMLQAAMKSSAEVTPTQGMAAALLAAVPTLGGYLIGRNQKVPTMPAGTWMKSFDDYKNMAGGIGAAAGLGQGAAAGAKASTDYIGKLEADQKQANQVNILGAKAEIDAAEQLRRIDAENAQLDTRLAAELPIRKEQMDLERRRLDYYDKAEARRAEGQEKRLSGAFLKPPSEATKKKMAEAIPSYERISQYADRFDSLMSKDPSYLKRNIDKVLPATELGQLQKDLNMLAVAVRNTAEPGVMTDPDYQRYKDYLTISSLDTVESVQHRFRQALTDLNINMTGTLKAAKAGGENTQAFEELLGIQIPIDYLGAKPGQVPSAPAAAPAAPQQQAKPGINKQDPAYLKILEEKRRSKGLL